MNIEHITDKITLISLDVRIWSGRKKLQAEDLRRQDGPQAELPPEDLVSLGSKRVCNPTALIVFNRLKKQAERACLLKGTRFLGGFAVPNEELSDVAEAIDAVKAQFEQERAKFQAAYDREIEEWIGEHTDWEQAIRTAIEPAEVIGGRLSFRYRPLRIAAEPEAPGTFEEDVAEIGEGIFHEVAQVARNLDASFLGKDELSQRAVGTFRRIREKLAVLSFMDYRIEPVLESIDDWLERVPRTGAVRGALFNEGYGLMQLICDAKRMAAHGAGQLALNELTAESDAQDEPVEPEETDEQGSMDAEAPSQTPALWQDDVDKDEGEKPDLMQQPWSTVDSEQQAAETDFFF